MVTGYIKIKIKSFLEFRKLLIGCTRRKKMLYFIVNEKSRGGRSTNVWKEIKGVLSERKVPYKAWRTQGKDHARILARDICNLDKGEITIIAVGGDGTINEVINGISDFDRVKLGVIPTGSGNDFARGMGINMSPARYLENIIDNPFVERIDLGRVTIEGTGEEKYFVISAGVGLDAIVCKKALTSKLKKFLNKIHLGSLTYILLTVQTLFSMETEDVIVTFDGDMSERKKVIFAAAMNFSAEGGGVPMAPNADAKDGLLSVCMAHGIPKWKTFFAFRY